MFRTPTPMQNFITIRLPSFGPQICKNAHQVTRLVLWFFPAPTAKTPAPIFTIKVTKTKFYILIHFPSKTQFFGQFLTGLGKFRVKTMGMLICKLHLIIIVPP